MHFTPSTPPPAHGYKPATVEPVRLREINGISKPVFLTYEQTASCVRSEVKWLLAARGAGLANLIREHRGKNMWAHIEHALRVKLWDEMCPPVSAAWEYCGHDYYTSIEEIAEQVAHVLKVYTDLKTRPHDKRYSADDECLQFLEQLQPEHWRLFDQATIERLKLHGKPYERSCPSPSPMSAATAALPLI